MTFQNKGFGKIPSARLDSHRHSVQNGTVESFPAAMATIFINFLDFCFEGVSLGGLRGISGRFQQLLKNSQTYWVVCRKFPENVDFTMGFSM